jgi:lipopolysaccharide transport system ATP-binding protein
MSDVAIQVEGVSKLYHIGKSKTYKTARETLMNALALPARLLRRREEDHSTDLWALRDVSFDVKRGEVIGIIGRNGAGKSTLLKVLSRITEPTSGKITLKGRVGSLLEVGTGFHPELSGRENIFLNGAILGMRRGEIGRKFDEIVAFSEVEKFIDTPVKHYSSGMYTRLAFAVAAHLDPEILIVDEVLAVGDAAFQRKCLGKMGQVAQSGRTVLFVSHNMSTISQFCTRGVLLERGQVKVVGDVRDAVVAYLGATGIGSAIVRPGESDHHREYNGVRNMQLLEAEVLDAPGGNFAVYWKKPLRLRLRVRVKRPLINVVFGFGIATPEGTTLLSGHRYQGAQGDEGASLTPGDYDIEMTVQNPLRPGRYTIEFGAHNAVSRDILFLLPQLAWLEVLQVSETGESGPTAHRAYVNTQSNWSLSPVEPAAVP